MAKIVGNDVSKWQGDIDWNTYKNNANFCIIKASEGTSYTDTKFIRNQSEGRRVGLPLGYYHFARPDLGNDAVKEADWFLAVIGNLQAGEVLALDYEPGAQLQIYVDWCKRFLDRVQEKTRVKPLIYLNQSQIKSFDWKAVVDGGYGLWVAAYSTNFITGQWSFAAMQQWTSSQSVPGIAGNVDGDYFFGDLATFKKYGYVPPVPVDPCASQNAQITELNKQIQAKNTEIANLKKVISDAKGYTQQATAVLSSVA